MAKTLTLYVITHTETHFNKRRIFTGRRDSELTVSGHRQAERFARRLKNKKFGLAFITPLVRTKQTFRHIQKYHPSLRPIIEKRLAERDYGDLEGKSKVKYRERHPGFYNIYHRSYDTAPPHGESMVQVERRVLAALKQIVAKMKQQKANAIIVAHNNSVRPIRRYFEKLTPQEMMDQDNYHKIFIYKIKA